MTDENIADTNFADMSPAESVNALHETPDDAVEAPTAPTDGCKATSTAITSRPRQICRFLDLPLEIRQLIYIQYFHAERACLHRHKHYDYFRNPCCKWDWPNTLILCDQYAGDSSPETPFFLPPLSFANKQLRAEVAQHLLRYNKNYVLKYWQDHPVKISAYFTKFLDVVSVPGANAFDLIHHLSFPHISRRAYIEGQPNPDVTLMIQCRNLRTVRFTVHGSVLNDRNPTSRFHPRLVHRPVDDVLRQFGLRPIVDCENLKEVYLDGIVPKNPPNFGRKYHYPSKPLTTLGELGIWMLKAFKAAGKDTKVFYHERRGAWRGGIRDWTELQVPVQAEEPSENATGDIGGSGS